MYHYFFLHTSLWQEHPEAVAKVEAALQTYIAPYWDFWLNAKPDFIKQIYNEERNKNFKDEMEKETLYQWLERLNFVIQKEEA